MIQECIEKNRDTIARWAKWIVIVGWILLITLMVMLPLSMVQLSLLSSIQPRSLLVFVFYRIISPAFFVLLFLVLGQFLKYEVGLEKQAGWFLRNGVIILRVYAVLIIGFIIFETASSIIVITNLSKYSLWITSHLSSVLLSVPKVLLLWGAASMLKMMISGMRENTELNA